MPIDQKRTGKLTADFTDQIFINPFNGNNQYAAVKLDIEYSAKDKVLNLSKNEFVCHAQTSRQRNFALYIHGLTRDRFLKVCDQFQAGQKSYAKGEVLYNFFVQDVRADNTCKVKSSVELSIKDLSIALSESKIASKIGTCVSTALKGAVGTVTGLAEGLQKSFTLLLKNPKELWAEVKKQVVAVKEFVLHIKDELIQLKKNLTVMNEDLLLELGCHVSGEILASIGIGAVSSAGLVKLSARLIQLVEKLKNSKTILTRLNSLMKTGQNQLAKEILSCEIR